MRMTVKQLRDLHTVLREAGLVTIIVGDDDHLTRGHKLLAFAIGRGGKRSCLFLIPPPAEKMTLDKVILYLDDLRTGKRKL